MEIRPALPEELGLIMELYSRGRQFMRQSGNENQWINGYPSRTLIEEDLRQGRCFLALEEGETAAVFCFFQGEEPSYREIDGAWISDGPYGVVHRIVSAGQRSGIVQTCTDWCLAQCHSLKIDTHRDNLPMRRALERCGFSYCGVIVIEDGTQRLAYQKIV
ncbi:MAG: GNAT family N-acetyltransferase [Oscillospiraceae bacterium]|nr:GNAT family N-acetyltransferase [Oscillospiraceae bacterium]